MKVITGIVFRYNYGAWTGSQAGVIVYFELCKDSHM